MILESTFISCITKTKEKKTLKKINQKQQTNPKKYRSNLNLNFISFRSFYDLSKQKINCMMTIVAQACVKWSKMALGRKYKHNIAWVWFQFLNSQVPVHIFCNSTSYHKNFPTVSQKHNVTYCKGMSVNKKGACEIAVSVFMWVHYDLHMHNAWVLQHYTTSPYLWPTRYMSKHFILVHVNINFSF